MSEEQKKVGYTDELKMKSYLANPPGIFYPSQVTSEDMSAPKPAVSEDYQLVGYTDEECDRIDTLLFSMPCVHYGQFGPWEDAAIELAAIAQKKRDRDNSASAISGETRQ